MSTVWIPVLVAAAFIGVALIYTYGDRASQPVVLDRTDRRLNDVREDYAHGQIDLEEMTTRIEETLGLRRARPIVYDDRVWPEGGSGGAIHQGPFLYHDGMGRAAIAAPPKPADAARSVRRHPDG